MTQNPKNTNRIFEAVHETAKDLHRLGLIDEHTMSEFDVRCLDPSPEHSSKKIHAPM